GLMTTKSVIASCSSLWVSMPIIMAATLPHGPRRVPRFVPVPHLRAARDAAARGALLPRADACGPGACRGVPVPRRRDARLLAHVERRVDPRRGDCAIAASRSG